MICAACSAMGLNEIVNLSVRVVPAVTPPHYAARFPCDEAILLKLLSIERASVAKIPILIDSDGIVD